MNKQRFLGVTVLALTGVVGVAVMIANVAGLRLNITASAPVGLWHVSALDPSHVQRGMLVSICPPALHIVSIMRERRYIPIGDCPKVETVPLLKSVVAVAGDRVAVSAKGLAVNGNMLVGSRPVEGMPPYPFDTYTVPKGHVWIASTYSSSSFDSRYFGPVALTNLRGQAAPIIVHGEVARMVPPSFGANHPDRRTTND